MELNAFSGSRPSTIVFDVNSDGSFTSADTSGGTPVSGVQPPSGAPLPPSIVRQHNGFTDDKKLRKYSSTTAGDIIEIDNPAFEIRKSWRRIIN